MSGIKFKKISKKSTLRNLIKHNYLDFFKRPNMRGGRVIKYKGRAASFAPNIIASSLDVSSFRSLSIGKTAKALLFSTILAAISALTPMSANAQTLYWDGTGAQNDGTVTGGVGTWDAAATNWTNSSGIVNQAWTGGGDAVFGGTAGGVVELEGDQNVDDIVFSTSGYNISNAGGVAGDLVLSTGITSLFEVYETTTISAGLTGGGSLRKYRYGSLTISSDNNELGSVVVGQGTLILTGSDFSATQFNPESGGTLIVNNSGGNAINDSTPVRIDGTGIFEVQANEGVGLLSAYGTGGSIFLNGGTLTTNFDNSITVPLNAEISGTGGFIKNGAYILNLTGSSTYTGATTINGGTLQASNASALGDNSALTVNGAGTLNLSTDLAIGSLTGAGNVTLNTNNLGTGGDNSSTGFSGIISGTGDLSKNGSGTQILSGANTYAGTTTISAGILNVTGSIASTSIDVNGGQLTADAAALASTASVTVTSNGTFLNDGNNSINSLASSAGTTINLNAGILNLNSSVWDTIAGNITGAGGITKTGSGWLTLTGINTYTGLTTINAGTISLDSTTAISDVGTVQVNGGSRLNVVAATSLGSILGSGQLTISVGDVLTIGANDSDSNYSGVIGGSGANTGGRLIKQGNGTLTLLGSNILGDGILVEGGTLSLQNDNAAGGASGSIITTGSIIDYGNGINIATTININSDTTQLQVSAGSATQSGIISETSAPRPLEKIGAGELILTGANTYTGTTSINAGTLSLSGGAAIIDAGNVAIGAGGTLNIMADETIGSLEGAGNIIFDGAQTLTSGGNDSSTVYSGLMSDTFGRLTKTGLGTMTMSGNNNVLALVTLDEGNLELTGENFTSSSGFSVQSGGILVANNIAGNAINDSNTITILGTGTFEIQSNETISSMAGSGSVSLNGANLTFGDSSNFNSTGIISGTGGLVKQGSGTQTISGANTYTGTTIINSGTIVTDNISALGNNSAVTLNAAGTLSLNANLTVGSLTGNGNVILGANSLKTTSNNTDESFSGAFSGTGALTKDGAGTLTLSGNNSSFSGDIILAGGTLSLQDNNAAGDGSGTIFTTGSTIDYANGITNATAINVNSNTTKLQVLVGSATQSGIISETAGPRPLEKIGVGELILTGTNTYTGLTTISAGTLSLNGGAAIFDTGAVSIASAGTLNIMASETIAAMNNAGAINLTNGAIGNNLTIAGDYSGVGVINIDVDFSTDQADQLIVGGNVTSGTTTISVSDITSGVATGNDVLVVDVAGTSNAGDFTLAGGSIISGAYTYQLSQTGNDWFLGQSLSPLTATYEIYPQTLNALNSFSTMRQRTSSRVYKDESEMDNGGGVGVGSIATNGDKNNSNIWGIIEASHATLSPTSSSTASTYDNNIWKIKAGIDGLASANENGKFIVGLNGYYGTNTANIISTNGNGSIFTQGFGLGLSGTYFEKNGFYVDGQLQVSWNYSDLNSAATSVLATDNLGQTYGASLELGQKIALSNGLAITPNAQLTYISTIFNGFNAPSNESISLDHANSLIGRLGVIVESEQVWSEDDGTKTNSSVYGLANIYYDFSGASQVDVSTTKLITQPSRLSAEIGLGGSYDWGNGKYSLTGEASISSSLENIGNDYQYKGSLGFKAKF